MEYLRLNHYNFAFVALSILFCFTKANSDPRVFNLRDYGAIEGGKVNINQALGRAWNDACKSMGQAQLVVPSGTYLVYPIQLSGPCKGPITFLNQGTLKAPMGQRGIDHWITFQYIDGLAVQGGGIFDGSGPPTQPAPGLPTMVRFNFVRNSLMRYVSLVNSPNTHVHLFACNNTRISNIRISSPGDSPNTDGIKVAVSRGIEISDSVIASGDDCVAILTGSVDVTVTRVACGPGHGISIGSLGGSPNELVQQIIVSNCNFTNTMNGVRIKTKATNNPGLVSDVQFQNILMNGAGNPILIDQNYCPSKTCGQGNSRVQIKNVKYINIRGTSKIPTAVSLQCSGSNPCENIGLTNIDLELESKSGPTISSCSNVKGQALGTQVPKPCISSMFGRRIAV